MKDVSGVITGSQIRAGRMLLRWERVTLAHKASLSAATLVRAEGADDAPPTITVAQCAAIQRALEAGGVVFNEAGEPAVRPKTEGPAGQ